MKPETHAAMLITVRSVKTLTAGTSDAAKGRLYSLAAALEDILEQRTEGWDDETWDLLYLLGEVVERLVEEGDGET